MIPKYDEMILPILKIISDGQEYNNSRIEDELSKVFNFTDEDRKMKHKSGVRIVYDRISWTKSYMKQARLIEVPKRGIFNISARGLQVLEDDIDLVDRNYLMKFQEFRDFINRGKNENSVEDILEEVDSEDTPLETIEKSMKKLNSSLIEDVLEKLIAIDFYKFEDIVLDLLIKMGYGGSKEEAKQSTSKTQDGGIDGIINEDRLGLDRIYIQAKRWKDTVVGRPEIQKFSGALDTPGAMKGVFITTSTFSDSAIQYAKDLVNKKIILIDGIQLANYMIEFNLGVSTDIVYEIKRIDSDYFLEE
ncbi:MAG: restriction endonuclease [Bdellovibrionota bacterium]